MDGSTRGLVVFCKKTTLESRGFSKRSVGRFCHSNNIHRTARVDDESLDDAVTRATCMVTVMRMSLT